MNTDEIIIGIEDLPTIITDSLCVIYSPWSKAFLRIAPAKLLRADTLQILKDNDFLIPKHEHIESKLRKVRLGLFLTSQCNLNCSYCYLKKDPPTEDLSIDLALKTIDYYLLQMPSRFYLSFTGGEPTLRMNLLREIVRYVEDSSCESAFHISTNGLLEDAQMDFLLEHRFSISVSMDGIPLENDRCRVTKKGQETSAKVESTIRALAERHALFQIRATLHGKNLASFPCSVSGIIGQIRQDLVCTLGLSKSLNRVY